MKVLCHNKMAQLHSEKERTLIKKTEANNFHIEISYMSESETFQ